MEKKIILALISCIIWGCIATLLHTPYWLDFIVGCAIGLKLAFKF